VIVSLALFFAEQVFRLGLPVGDWNWVAMGICLVAAIALTRFKVGTIKLIAACALAGLVVSYLP
ncbi:MAG: chromate efflux transporter, partial [Pseudomonadota bacterium]